MNPLDLHDLARISRRRFFAGAANTIGAALGTAALADGMSLRPLARLLGGDDVVDVLDVDAQDCA